MIEGVFIEGLVYGIMVLGVFITFRILDFPDLTVDGSFPFGAAIMASLILNGYGLLFALSMAFAGGVVAGCLTAVIHNRLKVPSLLAGILTMTMLYSINIRVLGNRSNLPLLRHETVLTKITALFDGVIPEVYGVLLFFLLVTGAIVLLLTLFFKTDMGLTLGAMGNNPQMVVTQGVNPDVLKVIGVGLSNGLVGLSGAFAAQYQGFADVGLGQGIIISGLAAVMIGEFVVKSNRISVLLVRALIGSVIFKGVMYAGRKYGYYIGMTPNDLKLITGLLIIALLALTRFRVARYLPDFGKKKQPAAKTGSAL